MKRIAQMASCFFVLSLAMLLSAAFVGCDNKEKLLDIETPGGDVEVERSTDTGEVDVDVDVDDK